MKKVWIGVWLLALLNPVVVGAVARPATVERIAEEKMIEVEGANQLYQKVELKITKGEGEGKTVVVENGNEPLANVIKYREGDRVIIDNETNAEGVVIYTITDFERKDALVLLLVIFGLLAVWIAGSKGLWSLISMTFTFGILLMWILPRISAGDSPLLVASTAAIVIIPITFYLSHGLNRKTTAAIIGSVVALIVTSGLASWLITIGHLTGLSSEEAGMLQINRGGVLNMSGLLLAGIVIGTLGVLDDITVAQAAIVDELTRAGKPMKMTELYARAMNVGKDHITSMVNTLVLAYAGASLPLLLMFVDNPRPLAEVFNNEMIAEEIIRTMVGSIGLIIAVPITTIIAAYMMTRKSKPDLK